MRARCSHSVGQGHHTHTLPTTSAGRCGRWRRDDRGLWSIRVLPNGWVEKVDSTQFQHIYTYFKIIEDISKVWIIFGLDGSEWGTNAILYATLTFKIIFPPQHDAKRSAKSSPLVRSSSTCKGSSSEKCGYKFLSSNGPSFQAHSCQMLSISKASWLM